MTRFINHKRFDCDNKENVQNSLQCSSCFRSFHSPWSLLKHVQNVHNLQIFYEELDTLPKDKLQQPANKTTTTTLKNVIEEAVSSSILSLTTSAEVPNIDQPTTSGDHEKFKLNENSKNSESKTTKTIDCKCCEVNVVTTTAESPNSSTEEEVGNDSKVSCGKMTCCCMEICKCEIGTVMQKCCSSIVPKKRPRHFMKHLEERQQNDRQTTGIGMTVTVPESIQLSPSSLDTHMTDISSTSMRKKKLNGNKAFMCEVCGEGFNQRIHLKKHMSKHTGIKPYKCDQCNYATVERSHLKVHNRIHTGEKPFKCNLCDYATAQNSTLKIHVKRHHNQDNHVEMDISSHENHQQQSITTSQDSDSLEDLLMLSASLLPS